MSTASGYAAIISSFKLDLEVSGLSKSTVSHYVRHVFQKFSFMIHLVLLLTVIVLVLTILTLLKGLLQRKD